MRITVKKNLIYYLNSGKKVENRGKVNEYIKVKIKIDLNFKLAGYMRNWICKAYKSQNIRKTKKL